LVSLHLIELGHALHIIFSGILYQCLHPDVSSTTTSYRTRARPFIADEQVFAPFPEAVANDRWHVVCYSGYVRMPRRVLAQLGGGGGGGGGGAIACYRVLAQLSLRFAWLLAALAIACQLS